MVLIAWTALALAANPFPDCDPYSDAGPCGLRNIQVVELDQDLDAEGVLTSLREAVERTKRAVDTDVSTTVNLAGTDALATGVALVGGEAWVQVTAGRVAVVCRDRGAAGDLELATGWCVASAQLLLVPTAPVEACEITVEDGTLVHSSGVRATLPAAPDWVVDCTRLVAQSASLKAEVAAHIQPAPSGSWNELAWLLDIGSRTKKAAKASGLLPRGGLIETHDGRRVLTYGVKVPGAAKEQHWHAWASVLHEGRIADVHVTQFSTGMVATPAQRDSLIATLQSTSVSAPE